MTSGRSTCDGLDRPTLAEYSIDERDGPFTMDDAGNGNSVNVRDGNNVDDAIDNLTNRYDSVGEKMAETAIRLLTRIFQSHRAAVFEFKGFLRFLRAAIGFYSAP